MNDPSRTLSHSFTAVRSAVSTGAAALIAAGLLAGCATAPEIDEDATPIVVFDLEVRDQSDPAYRGRPQERELELAQQTVEWIRESLAAHEDFRLVDHGDALEASVAEHVSRGHIHGCVPCQLRVAEDLGAEEVFTGSVTKVSNLILSAHMQHYDAVNEQAFGGGSVDMRSNDLYAWQRAFSYLMRNTLDIEGFPIPELGD